VTVLKGLDTRLKLAKLHLITDTRAKQGDLKDFLVAAISGGVDLVELRDPQATDDELVEALELARSIALQLDAGVIVGGSLGAAERFGADYLHLGAAAGAVDRGGLSEFAIVGRSVHSEEQVRAVSEDDAIGWMLVGPVYGAAKLNLQGLDLVRRAAEVAPVGEGKPWFAVGSINEKNLAEVVEAGALRVSVSGAITAAKDPQAAAERIKAVLQQAWNARPELEQFSIKVFGDAPHATLIGSAPVVSAVDEDEPAAPVVEDAPVEDAPVEDPPVEDVVPADEARAQEPTEELPAGLATAEVPAPEQPVEAPAPSEDLESEQAEPVVEDFQPEQDQPEQDQPEQDPSGSVDEPEVGSEFDARNLDNGDSDNVESNTAESNTAESNTAESNNQDQ